MTGCCMTCPWLRVDDRRLMAGCVISQPALKADHGANHLSRRVAANWDCTRAGAPGQEQPLDFSSKKTFGRLLYPDSCRTGYSQAQFSGST